MGTLKEDPNLTSFNAILSKLSEVDILDSHLETGRYYGLQDLSDMPDSSTTNKKTKTNTKWLFFGSHSQWIAGIFLLFLSMVVSLCSPSAGLAGDLTLAWDPIEDTDLANYRIYASLEGESYGSDPLWEGDSSSCTITDLDDNISYCFVVRTSNLSGIESGNSNEICYQIASNSTSDEDDQDITSDADDQDTTSDEDDQGTASDADDQDTTSDEDDQDTASDANDQEGMADTDGDGMPDDWETKMGLDPEKDDSQEDPDGDNISNLDEYLNGSDPGVAADNLPPQKPEAISPVGGNTVDSLTPQLLTEEFYDEDDDATTGHLKSQWQIIRSCDGFTVFNVKSKSNLIEFTVPKWILEPEVEYYWQVRFFDIHGAASQWSSKNEFETPIDLTDRDGDGVHDSQEIDENQDLNEDGIPDTIQPDTIKCVANDGTNGIIGIGISDSKNNNLISGLSNGNLTENVHSLTENTSIPYGLFEYKIEVTEPGSTVQIEIFLPQSAEDNAKWYQLGVESSWIDYSKYSQFSSDRKTITLELKDGDYGDIDGIENSVIVDRSGLIVAPQSSDGAAVSSSTKWGGSNACFVNSLEKTTGIKRFYFWLAVAGVAMMALGKIAALWRGKLPRTK
ncbi:MAG: hypothetical protein PVI90_07360 [Desulfobacteraceae bacterium]|jgi:hypothetical protein